MSAPAKPLPILPGLIDSHAHVHSGDLAADLARVLDRARAAGVEKIVTIGTTLVDRKLARDVEANRVGNGGRSAPYGGS